MKILKRNYGHRNLILFLILSLAYLQAVYSLSVGRSFFSLASLQSFFKSHYFILVIAVVTGFMVINIKKYSELMLLICLTSIVGKNFILLSGSFNKLTLILSFLYLVFAFYFFVTWELEVSLASFNPCFSIHDLEKESRFRIQARIYTNDDKAVGVNALVTNIDEHSCFLLLNKEASLSLNPSAKFYLESVYEGIHFRNQVRLVSAYDRGFGFVFEKSSDTRVSWSELYKVCLQRGLVS